MIRYELPIALEIFFVEFLQVFRKFEKIEYLEKVSRKSKCQDMNHFLNVNLRMRCSSSFQIWSF